MKQNFSLENAITDGIVQYIEEIKTDLNTLQIILTDLEKSKKTILETVGFNNLSFILDFKDGIISEIKESNVQSIIGFSYEKLDDKYLYCLKTEEYEIKFESRNFPSVKKLNNE